MQQSVARDLTERGGIDQSRATGTLLLQLPSEIGNRVAISEPVSPKVTLANLNSVLEFESKTGDASFACGGLNH